MSILFGEQQRFTQWWLFMGLVPVMVLEVVLVVQEGFSWPACWPMLISLFVFCPILLVRMRTEITEEAITIRYFPLLLQAKVFSWPDINKAYVRKYKPLSEYGGWGIKAMGSKYGKAYNVKGNHGLQLELKDGTKVLIGTQRMQELDQVLQQHIKQYTNN